MKYQSLRFLSRCLLALPLLFFLLTTSAFTTLAVQPTQSSVTPHQLQAACTTYVSETGPGSAHIGLLPITLTFHAHWICGPTFNYNINVELTIATNNGPQVLLPIDNYTCYANCSTGDHYTTERFVQTGDYDVCPVPAIGEWSCQSITIQ